MLSDCYLAGQGSPRQNEGVALIRRSRAIQAALALIALAGLLARVWTLAHRDPRDICVHDFPPLWAGAQLVGTPDLYSAEVNLRLVQNAAGCASEADISSNRPPFVAAMLWPLGRLPIRTAMFAWGLVGVAALIGFLWLWPAPKLFAAAVACWALPVSGVISQGQDDLLLLLWVAIAAALLARRHPFAAGMVLALCSAKPHLFLLLPLFLIGRRLWNCLWGLLAGGAILAAVSFILAGAHWPADFLRAALSSKVSPHPWSMPNLRGLFYGLPFHTPAELILSLVVAWMVWRIVRSPASMAYALAATLVGGLLISHHAYLPDAALLFPAALTVPFETTSPAVGTGAVLTVLPLAYIPWAIPSLTFVPEFLILVLLAGMAWSARRAVQPADAAASLVHAAGV